MPLSVIQALPALEVGGVERGTLEVAAELAARGHRSIVISSGGRLVSELARAGSEHINCPIGKKSLLTFRHVFTLREIFRRQNIDIVHARSRLPAWLCWLALRGMPADRRPAFITTVHGPYSVNAYSRIMCYGKHVIAISE
ncbi:MAG: glycosyltransferase, partial [Thiotrichales bacterium]|nr:glycosyltransferase [Thiotrichales bacterium]